MYKWTVLTYRSSPKSMAMYGLKTLREIVQVSIWRVKDEASVTRCSETIELSGNLTLIVMIDKGRYASFMVCFKDRVTSYIQQRTGQLWPIMQHLLSNRAEWTQMCTWKKEKREKLPNGKSDQETCRDSNRDISQTRQMLFRLSHKLFLSNI